MERKELPDKVAAKVSGWLGHRHSVLHFWESERTFFIVARGSGGNIYCLRVFPVGKDYELSQDNVIYEA